MSKICVISLAALGAWAVGCAGSEPEPEPEKGSVYESSRQVTAVATVQSVDLDQRRVTLKGPHGNTITCAVDERVRNLAQVKPGDRVSVTYVEASAVEVLKKAGPGSEEMVVQRAGEGEKPAGKAARQATMSAEVVGIDRARGTITLKGESGDITTVAVRHPERLSAVKVGDFLKVSYRESIALTVEPAPDEVR